VSIFPAIEWGHTDFKNRLELSRAFYRSWRKEDGILLARSFEKLNKVARSTGLRPMAEFGIEIKNFDDPNLIAENLENLATKVLGIPSAGNTEQMLARALKQLGTVLRSAASHGYRAGLRCA